MNLSTFPLLLSLSLALAPYCLLGGVLFGTVKDENGKPVAGATVRVYGKEISATTDSQGRFRIESKELLDGNMYSVTVSAEGYDDAQTIGTEMFDDPEEMEPLEITLYKTEPLPEPTTNLPPTYVEGLMPEREPDEGATNEVGALEEPLVEEPLLDVEQAPTNAPTTNSPPAHSTTQ
ncbi:MAG: carboxypeptidase-like regulatory domain-containing protein [bacterium]|nr:carboxypeptidase-like regulatory domain-containing protein [bacterium]